MYNIISFDDNGYIIKITTPVANMPIEEIAVLSIPELRDQLDVIMLGVDSEYIEVDYQPKPYKTLTRKKLNGIFTERYEIVEPKPHRKKVYNKVVFDGIYKEVANGNIKLNRNIDPITKKCELYTQETPKAFLERKDINELKSTYKFDIVKADDMPSLIYSYKYKDNKFVEDVEKAKELQTTSLRKLRDQKLNELDKDLMIAERNNASNLNQLKEYRQKLLDAPATYNNDVKNIKLTKDLLNINLEQYVNG